MLKPVLTDYSARPRICGDAPEQAVTSFEESIAALTDCDGPA
jgi:hypothetical protein